MTKVVHPAAGWHQFQVEVVDLLSHPTPVMLLTAVIIVSLLVYLYTRQKGILAIGVSALIYMLPLISWHDMLRIAHL